MIAHCLTQATTLVIAYAEARHPGVRSHIGAKRSALTYVLYVLVAQIHPFALLALGMRLSGRSINILGELSAFLRPRSRAITVVFGLIFGTWFLLKALKRLDIV